MELLFSHDKLSQLPGRNYFLNISQHKKKVFLLQMQQTNKLLNRTFILGVGAAQKILFRMLEVVADNVYSNGGSIIGRRRQNEHVLRRLLEQLHTTMAIYHVWGSPFLGGGHLFKQHANARRKITGFVEKMQVSLSLAI